MKHLLATCFFTLMLAGCFWPRDVSSAPGGTKTIIPFPVEKWKATVILSNHLFYDRSTRTRFDIQIVAIDGKAFEDDGRRGKYYYEMNAGPHVVTVVCEYNKVKWTAEFDFLLDPGENAEITGDVTEDGVILWFADAKTGKPLTDKIAATPDRTTTLPANTAK